jgi:predicted aspartyl protease
MGRTIVEFEIANYADIKLVEAGYKTPDQIRRIKMQGVVDTGATRLVIPTGVALLLGLSVVGQSIVRYADHRRESRDVVTDAYITLNGRSGIFSAILEPARGDALLGAIVMEELDLLVDCVAQIVIPRDPNTILTEVEALV